ncbi:hypothetical protein Dimus_001447, partial [Dionaea muscipula]
LRLATSTGRSYEAGCSRLAAAWAHARRPQHGLMPAGRSMGLCPLAVEPAGRER